MRILFLTKYFPPYTTGGGEISTFILAQELVNFGHHVTVACQKPPSELYEAKDKSLNESSKIEIKWLSNLFPIKSPIFENLWFRRHSTAIDQDFCKNYDIIHTHDLFSSLLVSTKKLKKKKIVATIRDYWPICGSQHLTTIKSDHCNGCGILALTRCEKVREATIPWNVFRSMRYRINLKTRIKAFYRIDNHVFISQTIKKQIERILNRKIKGSIIANPLQQNWIVDQPRNNYSNKNLLFVGGISFHKGIRLVLDAFDLLNDEFRLTIAGTGEKKILSEIYGRKGFYEGRIKILGWVPHNFLPKVYSQNSVLLAPVIWAEPFGRNVIEAMNFGLPVITTNRGEPARIIRKTGGGIILSKVDSEQLASKIEFLFSDYSRIWELGEKGRKNVRKLFNPEKIVKKYVELYEDIINQN